MVEKNNRCKTEKSKGKITFVEVNDMEKSASYNKFPEFINAIDPKTL